MALQRCSPWWSRARRRARAVSKERQADPQLLEGEGSMVLQRAVCGRRNLSTTMGHSTGLIREQCPVW